MTYTLEYRRTVRPRPYETVTIGLMEEFDTDIIGYDRNYEGVKAQVDKWCEEALEEFGADA